MSRVLAVLDNDNAIVNIKLRKYGSELGACTVSSGNNNSYPHRGHGYALALLAKHFVIRARHRV